MTQILKEGGKTIIKTGSRIDTMNANQFEADIQPSLRWYSDESGPVRICL